MTSGLLLVDKPQGITSHDVISHLRRALKTKKVGHTGTLDPMATGVLPVLIGQATRLSRYLLADRKSYLATLRLGATTDTMDAEGQFTGQAAVTISETELLDIIQSFVGLQKQLPPMYSAKKVAGKKLCDLARQGVEIERTPCDITIHGIRVVDCRLPEITFEVDCSSGTYIRVLAHDIGQKAGCGAYLTSLRRTSVGPFTISQATPLSQIENGSPDEGYARLLPMRDILYNLPHVDLSATDFNKIIHGNPIAAVIPATTGPVALLYNQEVVAVGKFLPTADNLIQPNCVLVQE